MSNIRIGQRIMLSRSVDRYPNFLAQSGRRGTITQSDNYMIVATLDHIQDGAEHWDNSIVWDEERLSDFEADIVRTYLV